MSQKKFMVQSSKITLGIFLVVLGMLLYARQVGWIAYDFPVWPVVLVAFGAIVVASEMSK